MSRPHPIERGIALVRELILEDPALAAEYEDSRREFFGAVDPRDAPDDTDGIACRLADRRHLEWFALERLRAGGELPFDALLDRWRDRADVEERAAVDALRQSLTGVFEVRDVDPGRGLWLHDLLGHGEFPIAEAEASAELADGDVLAGRIYPLGDTQFRLSPAIAVFRNATLLDALRRDLSALREGRRATLRIAQLEIERMFFHERRVQAATDDAPVGEPDDGSRAPDPEAPRRLRTLLVDGGMEASVVDGALAELGACAVAGGRAQAGAVIADLLERAAFETRADLSDTAALAHEAFAALAERVRVAREREAQEAQGTPTEAAHATQRGAARAEPGARAERARPTATERGADRPRVAEALAAFDAGRADGADLDQLFARLEQDLGLEPEDDEDPGVAPDFPGVLGAIVQEFLWELGLVEGEKAALQHRGLMRLAGYGEQIGVFENFGPEHLLEFTARWSIERGHLLGARQAESLLASLEKFCRWIEEQHHSPLWTLFERTHGELSRSLPRVAQVNDALGDGLRAASHGLAPTEVQLDAHGDPAVRDDGGHVVPLVAPDAALERVASGDWALWRTHARGAELLLLFPPEAGGLFTGPR